MGKHILALDQGTTSSRAIVFDHDGRIVSVAQEEFPQLLPVPGEVEHDPEAIWMTQSQVAKEALAKARERARPSTEERLWPAAMTVGGPCRRRKRRRTGGHRCWS